jgi:hypothetical protein
MSRFSEPTTSDLVREEVVTQLRSGTELIEVERSVIQPAPLDEDEKAALWLLAWATATGVAGARLLA